jgi:transcriptional regulator with XRE-family HTH domain
MIILLDTLGTFISDYLKSHSISINELAKKTKIAHSTLDRWIAGDYKKSPNLDALKRLADFTEVDICYLVNLIYPSSRRGVDPDMTRLAVRIGQLPVAAQEMMDAILLGLSLKGHE